ncbi:MAG TPA: ABC transporter permease subunit [Candidatus Hydrogenedentes bacterium]|nr:ABC transporter permease subunit [Candidatus Hydrogenedentota bacterium]HQM47702.1 ABC transporter permease subunit [Candidatus Hydrogenedentota bacterium]
MRLFFPSWVIVKRELLTSLRRRRSLLYVLITVLPCMALIYTSWPERGLDLIHGRAEAAAMTQEFLGWYAVTLLGICALLTPAFAAASVSHERDMDTLDLLRTTMISRTGIILAKLASAAGLFMLVAIASAAVAASLFFATGLDWLQLLFIGVTVLLTTLTWALIGLACASRLRNFIIALALTYLIVFVLSGLPEVILANILGNWPGVTNTPFQQHIYWLFPPVVIVGIVTGQFTWDKYCVFLFGQACLACLAPFWAARAIGREREDRKRHLGKPIDDAAVLAARRRRFPYYLLDPLRRGEPIGDHANPMRVKELRWGLLGMQTRMIRAMYATMAVFMVLGIIAYGPDGVYMWFLLAMGFLAIAAPPFLMPAFSHDLQQSVLDGLRSTLLRPRQIILGKFAAGLAAMLPLMLGIFAASLILLGANLFFGERVGNFFTGYASLAMCAVLIVSLCLLIAQFTRKTATAFAMAYLAIILLFGGLWFGGLYATKWTLDATMPPRTLNQAPGWEMPNSYYETLEFHAQAWQFLSPVGAYGGIAGNTYYVEQPPYRLRSLPETRAFGRNSPLWGYESYVWQLPHPLLMWSASMVGFALLASAFILISVCRYSKVGLRDP